MTTKTPPTKASRRPIPPKAPTTNPPSTPARPTERRRTVTLAVVAGAHGVGGEVKLKLFTDDLSPYRHFNNGALTIASLRGNIARFAEVPDRTAAEALRGTALTVPRETLPPLAEDEYYHADLIGLDVVSTDGRLVGRIVAVENFGAGDVIEVERPDSKRFMAPLRPDAVPGWDAERLIIDGAYLA